MTLSRTVPAPILAFGLCLAAVYGAAVLILSRLSRIDDPDLIAGALTVDLTILVPFAYYLLLVRWRGWPAITLLPVFIVSVLLAEWLIPESRQRVLDVVAYGAAIAELTLITLVLHKLVVVRRAYKQRSAAGLDVYDALRESAGAVLGPRVGNMLAYELTVFYYALFGWGRAPEPAERSFTYRLESAYVPFAIALMIAVVVETVALHLLVQLWSPLAAWILTGISLYALIWVIGDTHAIRLRPIRIDGKTLRLRIGLRFTAELPLSAIVRLSVVGDGRLPRGTPDYLSTALLGQPNRRIELNAPTEILGPYGIVRRAATVDLQIDDAPRFDEAIEAAGNSADD